MTSDEPTAARPRGAAPNDQRWEAQLATVAAYLHEHGHLPRQGGDPHAAQLRAWINTQRRSDRSGAPGFTDHRRQRLDEVLPGWNDVRTPKGWEWFLAEVIAFRSANGRLPMRSKKAPDAERVLGEWLTNQRQEAKLGRTSFTAERRFMLDERLPGWAGPGAVADRWSTQLDAVAEFFERTGALPRHSDGPEFLPLTKWLSKQRWHAQTGGARMTAERLRLLDERIPTWRVTGHAGPDRSDPSEG